MVNAIEGKVVLITGAAERAGREFARRFVGAGARVVVNHLPFQQEQADELVAELGEAAVAISADITDAAQCAELVQASLTAFDGLDVLVHNASTFMPRPWQLVSEADFDTSFGVNVRGPFFLTQAAASVMLERGGGNIIGLLGNSLTEAWPEFIPHAVSKTAMGRLMEQFAVALAPQIACNSVAPSQFLRSDDGTNDQLRKSRGEEVHAGRTARAGRGGRIREADVDAVFEALLFYATCTPQVTGTTLRIDGGKALV